MAPVETPLDSPALSGGTLTQERLANVDEGDHERFSHYVEKAKILESAVTGKPVTALCGKKWVPSRDPERFPVCPDCQDIHNGLPRGGGKGGGDKDGDGGQGTGGQNPGGTS